MVRTLFICKELSAGAIIGVKCDYESIPTTIIEKILLKNYTQEDMVDCLIAGGNIASLAGVPENTCFHCRDYNANWRDNMPVKIIMFDTKTLFYVFTRESKWVKYKKGKKYILGDDNQWQQWNQ